MKNLTLFIFIFFSFLLAARAQQELTDSQKQQIQSENILLNGGFEAGKTSWTSGAGTVTSSTTAIKGKRSISVSLSSQTLNVYQDSTLYASQYAGSVQGLAYARVKTTLSTVKVCARQAGVTSSTLCVSHSGSGNWELLKVPFILSSTSNGIAINTSSSATGTVLIDDTFVGAVDLKVDTNNISNWTTGACTGTWANTTYDCKYLRYGDTMKLQVKATVTGAVSGNLSIGVPSGFTIDTSKLVNTSIQMPMGTGSFWDTSASQDYAIYPLYQNSSLLFIAYSTSVNTGVAALSSSAPVAIGVGDVVSIMVDIPIVGWASSGSIYSSTNADTDWQSYTPTGSWTGNVTYSGKWKRVGSEMQVRALVSLSASPTPNVDLTINLPSGYTIDTSKLPSSSAAPFGTGFLVTSPYIPASVSYSTNTSVLVTAIPTPTTNAHTQSGINPTGFTLANGNYVTVEFKVPIVGWDQSNIIIGQFNGLESCADTYQCTDTYSAKINSDGFVVQENIDWISGNCSLSDTSLYTCSLRSGLFSTTPNCIVASRTGDLGYSFMEVLDTSTNGIVYFRTHNGTGGKAAVGSTLICQKTGADYIGRTARAVASDQNTRTPSLTNTVIYSGFIANTGTASIGVNNGNWISSISRTGVGAVTINHSSKFGASPICTCSSNAGACQMAGTSTSVVQVQTYNSSSAVADASFHVICHGVAP